RGYRGRGYGRGYQGRGHGRGRGNGSNTGANPSQNQKKPEGVVSAPTKLDEATFDVGTSATEMVRFSYSKKYIMNYIKLKYKQGVEISTALETGKDVDWDERRPEPKVS
ncbi:MAG: hypothetical protein SGILL_008653, partial [Bacillariaceae sp.]